MSAEDVTAVRRILDKLAGRSGPLGEIRYVEPGREALARLEARLQEAERRGSLFHNLDLEARAEAAEAREAALREALEMIAAPDDLVQANEDAFSIHALRRVQAQARAALATDPESEEAPE